MQKAVEAGPQGGPCRDAGLLQYWTTAIADHVEEDSDSSSPNAEGSLQAGYNMLEEALRNAVTRSASPSWTRSSSAPPSCS